MKITANGLIMVFLVYDDDDDGARLKRKRRKREIFLIILKWIIPTRIIVKNCNFFAHIIKSEEIYLFVFFDG